MTTGGQAKGRGMGSAEIFFPSDICHTDPGGYHGIIMPGVRKMDRVATTSGARRDRTMELFGGKRRFGAPSQWAPRRIRCRHSRARLAARLDLRRIPHASSPSTAAIIDSIDRIGCVVVNLVNQFSVAWINTCIDNPNFYCIVAHADVPGFKSTNQTKIIL